VTAIRRIDEIESLFDKCITEKVHDVVCGFSRKSGYLPIADILFLTVLCSRCTYSYWWWGRALV